MPFATREQNDRREALRRLLLETPGATQRDLALALAARGFAATQSSVSRDLRELGVVKTARGYELSSPAVRQSDEVAAVAGLLRDLQTAGPHLVVIRTAIGAAQRVALALDRSAWPEIVGNVGGDDTVFTATPNAAAQRSLLARIERIAGRAGAARDA